MNEWFTVQKIDDDTFVISEYKHYEETHCYLLNGKKKSLLIDTGLGVSNIKEIVERYTCLPLEVVTTHVHWDHIGGHKYFNNIDVYKDEEKWLSYKFPIPLNVVKSNLLMKECDFPKEFNIESYEIFQGKPNRILEDREKIDLGNRIIEVIHTPGHSPGHICLYENARKYLFSGDLVYEGTLYAFYPTTNPVDFRNSIKKIKDLDIERILPGHHNLNISTELIKEIDNGFDEIYNSGRLKMGQGIFKFKNFSIQI